MSQRDLIRTSRLATVTLGGRDVSIVVRPSSRARRLRLVVTGSTAIEAVVPTGVSAHDLERFLHTNRAWLTRAVAEALRREASTPRLGLDTRGVVWLGGRALPVAGGRTSSRARVDLREDGVVVHGDPATREATINRFYRDQARLELDDAVAAEAERLGLRYARVAVRDQKTRWGSCSTNGTLSFSWRLVAAPRTILDYVVVHELRHLRELNHSARFWALLDAFRPAWRDDVEWLRNHGRELHGYNPCVALELLAT